MGSVFHRARLVVYQTFHRPIFYTDFYTPVWDALARPGPRRHATGRSPPRVDRFAGRGSAARCWPTSWGRRRSGFRPVRSWPAAPNPSDVSGMASTCWSTRRLTIDLPRRSRAPSSVCDSSPSSAVRPRRAPRTPGPGRLTASRRAGAVRTPARRRRSAAASQQDRPRRRTWFDPIELFVRRCNHRAGQSGSGAAKCEVPHPSSWLYRGPRYP